MENRLYHVDRLRVSVILTLIPYHAALTYTGLGDIYIKSPVKDLSVMPFLVISAPLDNFFMTLLFFLSGIGAFYALQSRNARDYRKERMRKLLVPFLLGTIFLCPVQAYTKALYYGFEGNLIQFIPVFFSRKIVYYLGYAHLWFLLYLFIISIVSLPLLNKWINDRSRIERLSGILCRGNRIFIPIVFICIAELFLRPISGAQTIFGDWANDIVYPGMFLFGFIYSSDLKIQERISRLFGVSKIIAAAGVPLYAVIYYMLATSGPEGYPYLIVDVALKGAFECAMIIFLMEFGRKYWNKRSSMIDYLSRASFSYYIMHLLPVSVFTYFFADTGLHVYVKYILVVLLSYISIFAIYELVQKRLLGALKKGVSLHEE